MATLRKVEITARVATKVGGSRGQGEAGLKAVLDTIQGALAAGDRVIITGFGTFEIRKVKAKRVRPIGGAKMEMNCMTVSQRKVSAEGRFAPAFGEYA